MSSRRSAVSSCRFPVFKDFDNFKSYGDNVYDRNEAAIDDRKPIMTHSEHEIRLHQSAEERIMDDADELLNRVANALQVKTWLHWRDPKFYHRRAYFSWESPSSYQPPFRDHGTGRSQPSIVHKHLDVFHRGYKGLDDEQCLDPLDGRVRKLFVQVTNQIYDEINDTTWRRTYIKNISPRLIRLAWWPYAGSPLAQPSYSNKGGIKQRFKSRTKAWTNEHWTRVALRWVPACAGLLIVVSLFVLCNDKSFTNKLVDVLSHRCWRSGSQSRLLRSCSIQVLELSKICAKLLRKSRSETDVST